MARRNYYILCEPSRSATICGHTQNQKANKGEESTMATKKKAKKKK